MSAPPKKTGMSLYANLLGESKGASTISGAPVKYDAASDAQESQKKKDASLQFQPIKRPQVKGKKAVAGIAPTNAFNNNSSSGTSANKLSSSAVSTVIESGISEKQFSNTLPQHQISTFDDWVGDEEEDEYYLSQQQRLPRERGGKRGRQNKKKRDKEHARTWDWDDIYDPSLPNKYADYKNSEEEYREIRDWKARLYYHQMKDRERKTLADGHDVKKPASGLNFAPPVFDDDPPARLTSRNEHDYDPAVTVGSAILTPQESTSDDMPTRPMRTSDLMMDDLETAQMKVPGHGQSPPLPPPILPATHSSTVTSSSNTDAASTDTAARRAEAQAKIAAFKAKVEASKAQAAVASPSSVPPPPQMPVPADTTPQPSHAQNRARSPNRANTLSKPPSGATISAAPVRYDLPPPPADLPTEEDLMDLDVRQPETSADEQYRARMAAKKNFGANLMKKWGWKGKDYGIGAEGNEGIVSAVQMKIGKANKGIEMGGGKVATFQGGKRRKTEQDQEEEAMTWNVVKFLGMLKGMDIDHEIENNNLMQDIGDKMVEQYGRVERMFIWREAMGGNNEVFVKFTTDIGALRAQQACNGKIYAENTIEAQLWPSEKLEAGVYA